MYAVFVASLAQDKLSEEQGPCIAIIAQAGYAGPQLAAPPRNGMISALMGVDGQPVTETNIKAWIALRLSTYLAALVLVRLNCSCEGPTCHAW